MRKEMNGIIYESNISGSDKAMMEREAKRLYPGKACKILKGKYDYAICVPLGSAKKGQPTDKVSLAMAEIKKDSRAARQIAKDIVKDTPQHKFSAKLYAVQLISELGEDAAVKFAWGKVYTGKSYNFIRTSAGLLGIAYTGKLTKEDVRIIVDWSE